LTPRYQVPRLTLEEMRNIVHQRTTNQVMFSDEVSPEMVRMVFMPLSMGALSLPPEVKIQELGSEFPPESLPGEPPKPVHPGYQDLAGDPPAKPILERVSESSRSDLEWGYLSEEDWESIKSEVRETNEAKIRSWEEASLLWAEKVDQDITNRDRVDQEYKLRLEEWQASLDQHREAVQERERIVQEWESRYRELNQTWLQDVGVLMGNLKETFPRSINGYPIFSAFQVIHREDWERIRKALDKEAERAKNIEI
jgi:hypothetical protein